MKEVTRYIADDGEEFDTKDECLKHDSELEKLMKLQKDTFLKFLEIAPDISKICECHDNCSGCPFELKDEDGIGIGCLFKCRPEEFKEIEFDYNED